MQKKKDTQSENWNQLVKYGLVNPEDFKKEKDSNDESTSDSQKLEGKES